MNGLSRVLFDSSPHRHTRSPSFAPFATWRSRTAEPTRRKRRVAMNSMEYSIEDVEECMKRLQESLFVNIQPIFTDRMESMDDTAGMIPLHDFCGVDISLNAKMLLIAGYLCSIYPESEDRKLFGRDDRSTVKTKGRKRRRANPALKTTVCSIPFESKSRGAESSRFTV